MKRFAAIYILALVFLLPLCAEEGPLSSKLKQKYSSVTFYNRCGGVYIVSYTDVGRTLYALVDSRGNVVKRDAVEYKMYPGYAAMSVIDINMEKRHKEWEKQMQQYNKEYAVYSAKESAYQSKLKAYNDAVADAEKAAKAQYDSEWNQHYSTAYDYYLKEAQIKSNQRAQTSSNTGILGAVLGAVATGLDYGLVKSKAESYANEKTTSLSVYVANMKTARKLYTAPAREANPLPVKPEEPKSTKSWVNVPFLQPCPYSYIEYSAIQTKEGYADVVKNGKHGLVNAQLQQVFACTESQEIKQGEFPCGVRVLYKGKYGLLGKASKMILPADFDDIMETSSPEYVYAKKNGKKGIYSAKGKQIYPCTYEDLIYDRLDDTEVVYMSEYGQYGVLDFLTKRSILPCKFTKMDKFFVGSSAFMRALVKQGGQTLMGVYAKDGTLILPVEYTSLSTTAVDGQTCIMAARSDKTIDLVDRFGIHQIPAGAYNSFVWENPYFHVEKGGKYGLVCFGKEQIPCKYSAKLKKVNGQNLFLATESGKTELIDYNGKVATILPPSADFYSCEKNHVVIYDRLKRKYGAIDYAGHIIVPTQSSQSYKISNKVDNYIKKKKTDIYGDNKDVKAQISSAFSDFDTQRKEELTHRSTFSFYAREYVERVIKDWQRRGEFEEVKAYQARVNERTHAEKVRMLTMEAERLFIAKEMPKLKLDLSLNNAFDPSHMVYKIDEPRFGPLLVSIPTIEEAKYFKANWEQRKATPSYFIDNDQVALRSLDITMPNGKTYTYKNDNALNYEVANVDFNFGKNEWMQKRTSSLKSISIVKDVEEVQNGLILASYNKEFRTFRMSGKEDTFPYALVRVHVEGDGASVKAAKENLKLYLGQSYVVESTNTSYPNMILYLVPKSVRYATLQGGDGCKDVQIMKSRILESNKIYDLTVKVL